jgi:hypothetical protein|tara:strand:- start:607 stop:1617 length:1011 start_codon:yes stop_codon:yes gene_type:complete
MFEYFYNEIFRSVIIGFGTLFNGIQVKKDSGDIRVPLAYGPTQKFLARMQQEADLNAPTQMTLPRMSFEFLGLQYDPSRKSTQTQSIVTQDPSGNEVRRVYMPVPYNMRFELAVMTKVNDDMLQITEQILPYFQPAYNLPINFLGNLKEKRDVPIQLDNITMEDDYEGNFDTRRALIYTFSFTAKTYIFGPISDISGDIIKKVSIGYVAGSKAPGSSPSRDLTYQVLPRATKDYTGDIVTLLAENVNLTDEIIEVDDGTSVKASKYIYVGTEEMYVEAVTGNKLSVKRGQDNTTVQNHVLGAKVLGIDYTDNAAGVGVDSALIQFGDDFGFDGNTF